MSDPSGSCDSGDTQGIDGIDGIHGIHGMTLRTYRITARGERIDLRHPAYFPNEPGAALPLTTNWPACGCRRCHIGPSSDLLNDTPAGESECAS
ncbi:hypothetical protein GCM10009665_68810 [Kitasatospora nipponensis]|uniref:Uncharacterized protein n=1 Tax=Kitasatospora nipponensis TaxID=258049 RepID=A0ABP4HJX2_9ACTN